jgi:hypothetical protein
MNPQTAINEHEPAPNGAKLEILILIDQDKWNELKAQGYSDTDLQKAIEKSITFRDTVGGLIPTPPVFDIESATLLKYY